MPAPDLLRESPPPYQVESFVFQKRILNWATPEQLRDFPWRHARDPYHLLISELMLRRTQARQVVPVFVEFFNRWPELETFLEADAQELSQVLWPLGLQWRIQNLLDVRQSLKALGGIPLDYQGLLSLPGVGAYVASAVLGFSRLEARPLIDTNTVRVIGRFFGLTVHAGTRRTRAFGQLAKSLVPLDVEAASTYHYGLLDLAATICKPISPACSKCPLATHCRWHLEGASSSAAKISDE